MKPFRDLKILKFDPTSKAEGKVNIYTYLNFKGQMTERNVFIKKICANSHDGPQI